MDPSINIQGNYISHWAQSSAWVPRSCCTLGMQHTCCTHVTRPPLFPFYPPPPGLKKQCPPLCTQRTAPHSQPARERRKGDRRNRTEPERTYGNASTNKSECRQAPVQVHASGPRVKCKAETGVKMRRTELATPAKKLLNIHGTLARSNPLLDCHVAAPSQGAKYCPVNAGKHPSSAPCGMNVTAHRSAMRSRTASGP